MVTSCSAYGCANRFVKNGIGFFRFPHNPVRRKLWLLALRRKNFEPSQSSSVCGEHFQTGRPSRDPNHPDYVPNVFVFKPSKKTGPKNKMEREEEERKRKEEIEERRIENMLDDNSVAEKNVNLETFSTYNTSQIKELSRMEEDVLNMETTLQQQYTEIRDTDIKQEIEVSEEDDELLNLKLELHQAYSDISALSEEKDELVQEHTSASVTQTILYSSISAKEGELSKLNKQLQQAYTEISALRTEKEELQQKLTSSDLAHTILQDPNKLHFYTGLNSMKDFHLILSLLADVESNVASVSREKQVLMVLMKLKLNLMHSDVAYRFQTSKATIYKIYDSLIPPLQTKLDLLVKCPVNNALKKNIPISFKNTAYENLYQRLQRYSKSKTKSSDNEKID